MMKLSDLCLPEHTHFIENWNQMLTLNEFFVYVRLAPLYSSNSSECSMPIFAFSQFYPVFSTLLHDLEQQQQLEREEKRSARERERYIDTYKR